MNACLRFKPICCAMLLLLGGGLADQASAKIITVVISGSASGSAAGIGGFTDAPLSWTITYDTSHFVDTNPEFPKIYLDPTTSISINGTSLSLVGEHGFWSAQTSGNGTVGPQLWIGQLYMTGETPVSDNFLSVIANPLWDAFSTPYSSLTIDPSSFVAADFETNLGQLNFTSVAITAVSATSSDYTFADWSGGATLTNALLLKYAIGGAATPSAAGEQTTVTSDGSTLSLTAVVRTDNSQLTISGEAVDTLAGTWSTAGVSSVLAASQDGLPAGCERRVYSVSISGAKKFLRLRATLAP